METLPFSEFFSRNTLLKVMCNSGKYLFPCVLCYLTVIQILWLCFISGYKDEWAALIVLFLQLWIYISVFRSRTKIRLLTEELYRISNMLRVYTLQKKKMLKIYIWVYCLFVAFMTVFLEVTIINSGMIAHEEHKLRNSELIPSHLKEHCVAIMYCSFAFIT
ncbi:hypothetical protein CDAR_41381 [Caerostris darwini]|uniref:Uncharacterized protein n=1 Tax=Caerostris darwini TaxID=1538125 RepID=A0AAV4RW96_9ARAC|nr:hypothetical protein CDAR_41381 [Caerostris darwini]